MIGIDALKLSKKSANFTETVALCARRLLENNTATAVILFFQPSS